MNGFEKHLEGSLYHYKARVTGAYDGDTITVDLDLGLGVWKIGEKIRLSGLNAPEIRGPQRPQGLISRDWLRERVVGKVIIIHTEKDKTGKYGRLIGTVYLDGENINELMISLGMAERREYR